jgi:nucleotide-binding universal stress UspA family protein
MSEVRTQLKRILLPLDVSRDSLAALEVACDLAVGVGGDIAGIFIEDQELLAAASLPFAREIGSTSGILRQIESVDIERRLDAIARRARDAMVDAGQRLKVPTSFHVKRGDVPAEILSAASDADIIVLGKAGWSIGALRKPGRTCLAVLSKSQIPVMIVEQGVSLSPPVLAVHDDSPAGRRALEFAQELAQVLGWQMAVFSAKGLSLGDEVLAKLHHDRAYVIVLPSSLPLKEAPSLLKCAVLFVP